MDIYLHTMEAMFQMVVMLGTEMVKEVAIPRNTPKTVDIIQLRDIEQGILNYMLLSNSNFFKIKNTLLENDFIFLIHKLIFKYILIFEEMFLSDNFHEINDLTFLLETLSTVLENEYNVKRTSTLDILSQIPSTYIDSDLEIVNIYSMEKEIAIHSNKVQRSGAIETKEGLTWFDFIDDRLISVGTTNIAQLPIELHDNFGDTLGSLSNLDLESGDNEASMTFYGDPENPDGIESFYLKKDAIELKWFDDICQWADKYDLDEDTFPRDRYKLQDLFKLNISDKGINEIPKEIRNLTNLRVLIADNNDIKELPSEVYQLKKLGLLSCMKNEISYISEEIINLQKLLMFAACHNNISFLPNNFFRLKNLTSFCSKEEDREAFMENLKYLYTLMRAVQPWYIHVERNYVPLDVFSND